MGQTIDYGAPAGVARFALFQKGPWKVTQFLMEWLTYCVNPTTTTFDRSVLGAEVPGFIEHRTEQAIMSNLAHKYHIELHREACQSGNGSSRDRHLYQQLFVQHDDDVEHVTAPVQGSAFANIDSTDCLCVETIQGDRFLTHHLDCPVHGRVSTKR
jgi:hypothetical protein